MSEPRQSKKLGLFDFIRMAIDQDYMIGILITSGTQGKEPSLGLDAGVGKSTVMCWILHWVYKDWER